MSDHSLCEYRDKSITGLQKSTTGLDKSNTGLTKSDATLSVNISRSNISEDVDNQITRTRASSIGDTHLHSAHGSPMTHSSHPSGRCSPCPEGSRESVDPSRCSRVPLSDRSPTPSSRVTHSSYQSPEGSRESVEYTSRLEMPLSDRSPTPNTGRSLGSWASAPVTDRSLSRASTEGPGCYRIGRHQTPDTPATPYFFNPIIVLDRNEILDQVFDLIKEREFYERHMEDAIDSINFMKIDRQVLTEQLKVALRLQGENSVTLIKNIVEFHQSVLEERNGLTTIFVDGPPVRRSTKTTYSLSEYFYPKNPGGKSSTQFRNRKTQPRRNYQNKKSKKQHPYLRQFSKDNTQKSANEDLSQRPPWDDSCFFIPKENKHVRKPAEQKSKPPTSRKTQPPTLDKDLSLESEIIRESDGNFRRQQIIDVREPERGDILEDPSITKDSRNVIKNEPIGDEHPISDEHLALSKNPIKDSGSLTTGMQTVHKGYDRTESGETTGIKPIQKESENDGAGDQIASLEKSQTNEHNKSNNKPCKPSLRKRMIHDGLKTKKCSAGTPPEKTGYKAGIHLPPLPTERVPTSAAHGPLPKRNSAELPPLATNLKREAKEVPSTIPKFQGPSAKSSPLKFPPIGTKHLRRATEKTSAIPEATLTATTKKINRHSNRTLDRLPPIAQPTAASEKPPKKDNKCPRLILPLLPDRVSLVSRGKDKLLTPPKAGKPKQQRPFLGKRL